MVLLRIREGLDRDFITLLLETSWRLVRDFLETCYTLLRDVLEKCEILVRNQLENCNPLPLECVSQFFVLHALLVVDDGQRKHVL